MAYFCMHYINQIMDSVNFIKNNWYSAVYESGFSIIFKAVEESDKSLSFCRKDGIIVDNLPEGYQKIVSYGILEPDYK